MQFQVNAEQVAAKVVELEGEARTPPTEPTVELVDGAFEVVPGRRRPRARHRPRSPTSSRAPPRRPSPRASTRSASSVETGADPAARLRGGRARGRRRRRGPRERAGRDPHQPRATAPSPPDQLRSWVRLSSNPDGTVVVTFDEAKAAATLRRAFADVEGHPVNASFTLEGGVPVIRADQPGTVCCTPGSAAEILAALQGGTRTVELELTEGPATLHRRRRRGLRDQAARRRQQRLAQRRPHHGRPGLHHLPRPHRRPDHQHPPHGRPRPRRGDRPGRQLLDQRLRRRAHRSRRASCRPAPSATASTSRRSAAACRSSPPPCSTPPTSPASRSTSRRRTPSTSTATPAGREATMGFPAPDLQFTNNTPYGILIWTSYTQSSLTITLYSTPYATRRADGHLRSRRSGNCTMVTTTRTITYPDGTDQVGQVPRHLPPRRGPALLSGAARWTPLTSWWWAAGPPARRRHRPRPPGPRRRARRQGHVPAGQDLRRRPHRRRAPPAGGPRARPVGGPVVEAGRRRRRAVAVGPRGHLPAAPRRRASTRWSRAAPSSTPRSSTSPAAAGVKVHDGHACTGARGARRPRRARGRGHRRRSRPATPSPPTACGRRCASTSASPMPGYRGEWHAFRQYFTDVGPRASEELFVWFEPDLLPGYALVVPAARRRRQRRLRHPARRRQGRPGAGHGPALAASCSPARTSPRCSDPTPAPSRRTGPGPSPRGWTTSCWRRRRTLFVGDAAAATDPMTGEGIGQALLTGVLAAEAIDAGGLDAATRRGDATSGACATRWSPTTACRCC